MSIEKPRVRPHVPGPTVEYSDKGRRIVETNVATPDDKPAKAKRANDEAPEK
jgi:hypothetical protein